MGKKCIVIFDRTARRALIQSVAALQYNCKKEQAPVLASLMAKCKKVLEEIDISGSAALSFDPDNEFEMRQLELLNLAMTGIALRAGQIIETLFANAPMNDEERKASITDLIRRYLPSLN